MSKFDSILQNILAKKRKNELAAKAEEFYNQCHESGGANGGRFCETPGGSSTTSTSTGKNSTATSNPGYSKAHKLLSDNLDNAEKAVESAKGTAAKNQARNKVSDARQERIKLVTEADRLGERVDVFEKQLKEAKGTAAKNRVRDFLADANRNLRAHINNKIGSYTGFAE